MEEKILSYKSWNNQNLTDKSKYKCNRAVNCDLTRTDFCHLIGFRFMHNHSLLLLRDELPPGGLKPSSSTQSTPSNLCPQYFINVKLHSIEVSFLFSLHRHDNFSVDDAAYLQCNFRASWGHSLLAVNCVFSGEHACGSGGD